MQHVEFGNGVKAACDSYKKEIDDTKRRMSRIYQPPPGRASTWGSMEVYVDKFPNDLQGQGQADSQDESQPRWHCTQEYIGTPGTTPVGSGPLSQDSRQDSQPVPLAGAGLRWPNPPLAEVSPPVGPNRVGAGAMPYKALRQELAKDSPKPLHLKKAPPAVATGAAAAAPAGTKAWVGSRDWDWDKGTSQLAVPTAEAVPQDKGQPPVVTLVDSSISRGIAAVHASRLCTTALVNACAWGRCYRCTAARPYASRTEHSTGKHHEQSQGQSAQKEAQGRRRSSNRR